MRFSTGIRWLFDRMFWRFDAVCSFPGWSYRVVEFRTAHVMWGQPRPAATSLDCTNTTSCSSFIEAPWPSSSSTRCRPPQPLPSYLFVKPPKKTFNASKPKLLNPKPSKSRSCCIAASREAEPWRGAAARSAVPRGAGKRRVAIAAGAATAGQQGGGIPCRCSSLMGCS